jgi:hypothetical protein
MQGKQGDGQSGRAILAQQQAGMTEMTPLLDNLRHFTLRVYRQIWNRVRQYWTAERWIRVTDDEKNVRFVGLNTPPEVSPQQAQMALMQVQSLVQAGQMDPQTAQQYAQQVQQKMQVGNHLAELDVDIEIEEVNETPTLQAEQFQELSQMAQAGVFGMPIPEFIRKAIIQASQLRDKQKIIEMMDEAEQGATQPQQQAAQLQMMGAEAEIKEKAASAGLKEAQADKARAETVKIGVEAQVKATEPHIEMFKLGTQAGPQIPAAGG